jgi:hypothetical protein
VKIIATEASMPNIYTDVKDVDAVMIPTDSQPRVLRDGFENEGDMNQQNGQIPYHMKSTMTAYDVFGNSLAPGA